MSELRDDLLTGTRVVVAPARSTRPVTVASAAGGPASEPSGTAALSEFVAGCAFCPGNEGATPPEVARTGPGAPDTPGWRVRVVPNKYPLVGTGGLAGAHEVVITSTAHNRSLADLNDDEAREVVTVWRDRVARQLADGHVHSHAFVNHGKGSGASIEHPHAQVIALDFVPPFVAGMLDRFAATGRDLVHDALEEARDTNCMIVDDALTASWCPPASFASYTVRFASPTGGPRFDRATDDELGALRRGSAGSSPQAADPARRRAVQPRGQHRARR